MSSSGQTFETEIKLRLPDAEDGRRRLARAGFQPSKPRLFEANILLDREDLSLRSARSVLRLRKVGDQVILTFKGPGQDGKHKVREELEASVSDLTVALAIFERIGFHQVFRYEKYRSEYQLPSQDGVATLDETPIGTFLELEGDADWIDRNAETLGFGEVDYVTSSYGQLYREYCLSRGLPPTNMVF